MTKEQNEKFEEIMEKEKLELINLDYEGDVEFEDVTYKEAIIFGLKSGVIMNRFARMISKTGKEYYLEYKEENKDLSKPDNVVEVII